MRRPLCNQLIEEWRRSERDPFCPFQPQHMTAGECSERLDDRRTLLQLAREWRKPTVQTPATAAAGVEKARRRIAVCFEDFPDSLLLISPCIFGTRSVTKVGTLPHYLEQDEGLIKTR